MKPARKKNVSTKKNVNGSASNPKIDTYFKATAKQFDIVVDEKNASDEAALRDVYIGALKKKLKSKETFIYDFKILLIWLPLMIF